MRSPLDEARRDPESLKAKIVRAARRVFARRGYHGATTREIAKQVGIDVSTLYYHWRSKQDLFDGVLEDLQLDFEACLRTWLSRGKDLPFDECFDMAVEIIGSFLGDRDVVRVLMYSIYDDENEEVSWSARTIRTFVDTIYTFAARRVGEDALPEEFRALVLSYMASVLAMIGSRKNQARILGLDPEGEEYRRLIIATARVQILAMVDYFKKVKAASGA